MPTSSSSEGITSMVPLGGEGIFSMLRKGKTIPHDIYRRERKRGDFVILRRGCKLSWGRSSYIKEKKGWPVEGLPFGRWKGEILALVRKEDLGKPSGHRKVQAARLLAGH